VLTSRRDAGLSCPARVVATLESSVPALRRYAATLLGGRQEVDNLVYDCLVCALDHLHTRRDDDDVSTWLFAIMRNRFIRPTQRKCSREQPTATKYLSANSRQNDGKESDNILDALRRLPEEQRSVLFLVSVEGLTYGAVAQVLEIPLGTVMSHLARGRERLQQIMGSGAPGASAGGMQVTHLDDARVKKVTILE
jgi:RNA polymerase sigma factor (sigma-70 family)